MDTKIKDLINRLLRAIEYEREEERERHLDEIKRLKGFEREKKGRALINLSKRKVGRTMGGDWLYQMMRHDKSHLPDTEINVGDQVIISQFSPLDETNPVGVVYEMSSKAIVVSVHQAIKLSNSRPFRIDLFVNDITYKRMEEALIYSKSTNYSKLHSIIAGLYRANSGKAHFVSETLNETQIKAVDCAMGNNGFYSIQGPPGTGKTCCAAELVAEIAKTKGRILVTADSNAAVDNLLRKLVELGVEPLRIGNPIRVNRDLKEHTLDYKVFQHVLYKDIKSLESQAKDVKVLQKDMSRPNMKHTRGIKYDKLLEMANRNTTARGISKGALKEMKPWLKAQDKLDKIYDKIQSERDAIQYELLQQHKVVATTNSTAGCDLLEFEKFDWLVMDEAAQASIPSSMIPLLKAERFVLIGDHFQLPPVVINREAKDLGLSQSLMDLLAELYPYQLTRLEVQYRMHKDINRLVSKMFYNDSLIPDKSVANRVVLANEKVVEVIHIKGEEKINKDSKSYFNQIEIEQVLRTVHALEKKGIKSDQIAIISPYKAQAIKISKALDHGIEVDTVDAFQGREKDVVIISFVRSNEFNEIGFLKDFRRLNVSISRAKSKLILIGNIGVLKENKMYNSLFNRIK